MNVVIPSLPAKNLILLLLKEDLRIQRLLLGLEELGFQADFYGSELFPIAIDLMELSSGQRKKAYELYFHFLEENLLPVNYYDLPEALKQLSKDLYRRINEGGRS